MNTSAIFRLGCGLALMALVYGPAAIAVTYDASYNAKRVNEISRFVLSCVEQQRAQFIKAHEEAGKNQNQNQGHGQPSRPGEAAANAADAAKPLPRKFYADIEAIKLQVQHRWPRANPADMSLDLRSAIEIEEAVKREMARDPRFKRSVAEMEAEERRLAEEKFPLYEPNEKVTVTFSRGNEKPRTYTGVFKPAGRFKFFIGKHTLNYNDLPEEIRARFKPELNRQMRQEEFDKHWVITRYNIEREEELAVRCREKLNAQFNKNLRKDWVYINKAWRVPADLVEDIVTSRETIHRTMNDGPHFSPSRTGIYRGSSN